MREREETVSSGASEVHEASGAERPFGGRAKEVVMYLGARKDKGGAGLTSGR